MSKMQATSKTATDFWNDSCDLAELEHAIREGAVGATSNPVIVATVVKHNPDTWGKKLEELIAGHPADNEDEIAWRLTKALVKSAAALLEPIYHETGKLKGRLAIQVNPKHFRNSRAMIEHALELTSVAPNLTIKIPATEAGLDAMEALTEKGVTVTATVVFTVAQAVACAEAMQRGLARADHQVQPFVALMCGRLDDHLKRVMNSRNIILDPGHIEWAGVAVFKKAYGLFRDRAYAARLLSAAYRNHMQWSQFIGGDVALTMPYKWWNRFNASDLEVCPRIDIPVSQSVVDELYDKFVDFRRAYDESGMQPEEFTDYGAATHTLNQFLDAYAQLIALVRERMLSPA